MSPVLEVLEKLAITIDGAGGPDLTQQDVLEARILLDAPANLPCMIVAPPLGHAGTGVSRRAA